MTSEKQIEQEIQEKGLNAPRLTPDLIDSKIKAIRYITDDKFDLAYFIQENTFFQNNSLNKLLHQGLGIFPMYIKNQH